MLANNMALTFTIADVIILAIIALSALISLFRGFVREALSLAAWLLAFWVAFHYYAVAANLFISLIHSPTLRIIAGFSLLFIIVLILASLINYLLGQLVDRTGLSGTDRLLGMLFGIGRGVLLIAALLLVARLTPMPQEMWWRQSILIHQFAPLESWLESFLPQSMAKSFELSAK